MEKEKHASYNSHDPCKSLSEELHDYYEGKHRSNLRPHSHRREKERKLLIKDRKEKRRNVQKGLWTRQYLNNTELSPNEQKEGKETTT